MPKCPNCNKQTLKLKEPDAPIFQGVQTVARGETKYREVNEYHCLYCDYKSEEVVATYTHLILTHYIKNVKVAEKLRKLDESIDRIIMKKKGSDEDFAVSMTIKASLIELIEWLEREAGKQ